MNKESAFSKETFWVIGLSGLRLIVILDLWNFRQEQRIPRQAEQLLALKLRVAYLGFGALRLPLLFLCHMKVSRA